MGYFLFFLMTMVVMRTVYWFDSERKHAARFSESVCFFSVMSSHYRLTIRFRRNAFMLFEERTKIIDTVES